jgi:hypothetical protein
MIEELSNVTAKGDEDQGGLGEWEYEHGRR